jgi:uncharacterized protein
MRSSVPLLRAVGAAFAALVLTSAGPMSAASPPALPGTRPAPQAEGAQVSRATGYVVDEAQMLDSAAVETLNALLHDHEVRTSNQVVVITVRTLGGEPLETMSLRRATELRAGQKGRDNGVLLFVAQHERKVRIEVGYGLEGALPDGLCGQIIRQEIVPRFKQLDYGGGLQAGVQAIMGAIRGEYRATPLSRIRGYVDWVPTPPPVPLTPQIIVGAFFWILSAAWVFAGPEVFQIGSKSVRLGVFPGLLIAAYAIFCYPGILIPLAVGVLIWADKRFNLSLARSVGGHTWSSARGPSSSSSLSSSSSDSSSSSFSGGGGSFGGGGASGGW